MIVVLALVVGALFGAGITLALSRDLFRMVTGVILISNALNLFLVSAGRSPVTTALRPLDPGIAADPLVQALTLTAVVITFGVGVFLLGLVIRVHTSHGTVGIEDLARAEREEEERVERERENV